MMNAPKQEDPEGTAAAGAARTEPISETSEVRSWMDELNAILDQAAVMAVEHGADPDQFMSAAHDACLRANPELREQVERTNMLVQMEALRRMGVLAQA
jgi:hypothetical protein